MHEPANEPNDLERFFVERANKGDLEGLVALYESNAIVAYRSKKAFKSVGELLRVTTGSGASSGSSSKKSKSGSASRSRAKSSGAIEKKTEIDEAERQELERAELEELEREEEDGFEDL